ncbi:hypothetical protein [Teredinibacter purpureus]|uniref:hypothetical protein n=1 Tax=Teredinibacter purpureus TaxID=2731756 RepID=UPI0005F7B304|nr:hypothetical protein [Teredinibacter purpureus]
MDKPTPSLTDIIGFVAFPGFGTQSKLTDTEIASRYPELGQLAKSLRQADEQDVELLSAELYSDAREKYKDALASAKNGSEKARIEAKQSRELLNKANSSTIRARDEGLGQTLR